MTKPATHELRLSVSFFYGNDDTRCLITSEEATLLNSLDDDEYVSRDEKFYECCACNNYCRMSRSSLLAVLLFCTLAVGVIMVTIVLLCTFVSMSSGEKDRLHEEVLDVINWLHYPIGDPSLRRRNHTTLTTSIRRTNPHIAPEW